MTSHLPCNEKARTLSTVYIAVSSSKETGTQSYVGKCHVSQCFELDVKQQHAYRHFEGYHG